MSSQAREGEAFGILYEAIGRAPTSEMMVWDLGKILPPAVTILERYGEQTLRSFAGLVFNGASAEDVKAILDNNIDHDLIDAVFL